MRWGGRAGSCPKPQPIGRHREAGPEDEQEGTTAFTEEFFRHFFAGYRTENRFDPEWLAEMPSFLKMREIDLYAVIHRSFAVENIENQWCAHFMTNHKFRIENEVPYVDFDFRDLRAYL
jgi:Ser/Thr protein kinase RdoA (MazF antagonist)